MTTRCPSVGTSAENEWPEPTGRSDPREVAKNRANCSSVAGENLLFGYWEYTGKDFAADGAIMAADPRTKEWWAICMPMQEPLDTRAEGEWWSMMEEVFHHD